MKAMAWLRVVVPVLLAAFTATAQAQSINKATLEKIREYGAIYVGHPENSVPFAYLDGDEVLGYSKELCDRIVETVKDRLDDPTLKVVMVPTTSASRLLMLLTGVIDLECGSTTNTKIRQQSVAFGVSTFVSGVKALVPKNSGIERIADLNGKLVVTTSGSTTERAVKTVMAARNLSVRSKAGRTHSDSFSILASGQADAFVLDDALLVGLLANSQDAGRFKLLDENFGFEPYGIVMRKDDPEFKKLVDATLIGMMKNGELEKLYGKWFQSPIPPSGVNLQIPMSNLLKELLLNPNDQGI